MPNKEIFKKIKDLRNLKKLDLQKKSSLSKKSSHISKSSLLLRIFAPIQRSSRICQILLEIPCREKLDCVQRHNFPAREH